jgi:hypothetical protein
VYSPAIAVAGDTDTYGRRATMVFVREAAEAPPADAAATTRNE